MLVAKTTNFTTAIEHETRQIRLRAYIGDTLLDGKDLIDVTVTEAVNASGGLSMGSAISSKLVMKIKTPETPLLLIGNSVQPEVACGEGDEWFSLGV